MNIYLCGWLSKFNGKRWTYPQRAPDCDKLFFNLEHSTSFEKDNHHYFYAQTRNSALTERNKRNQELAVQDIKNQRKELKSGSAINYPTSFKLSFKPNKEVTKRLKEYLVANKPSTPNTLTALALIKSAVKEKISQMIDDNSINSSEMEEARCLLFTLDDVEKFLNKE